jgi:SNF2 family DNA or RNA helicase
MEKPIVKSGNEEAMAQLQSMVQPFILRRLKKDVLKELPDKIDHVRRIQLSPTERKVYLAAAQNIKKQLGKGDGNKMAIFAALTQMRQICCDPHLAFENYKGEASKLEACLQLCEGMVENGHQILLFSQFTSMLEIIKERLDELGISNFTLQGSTPKEKRASLVKEFNEGKASVFLISLKAGGTGLNLTSADVVIHYDPWWNVAAQNQATDRTHRIGQDKHVHVYRLIAKDTIEEKILDLQDKKAQLMEAVSSENQTSLLEMSKEDLLALL